MSMQDPISDMLTRVRNAGTAGLDKVAMPSSKMKEAISAVLKTEGYITDSKVTLDGIKKILTVKLKYHKKMHVIEGLKRISKSSCRSYCGCEDIPRVRNGFATVVLSTPKGVISDRTARKENVGGEILFYVW